MAGTIKGITIEYSGNTTKLESALRRVKAQSKSIEGDLKGVNAALKFNPHNPELLAQKQQLLRQRIESTKHSLQDFKNIQKQLDAKGVDKTSQGYMRVRRNIIEAESKLRTFNAQLAKSKFSGMASVGKGLTSVGQKLTNATRYARRFALALGAIALYKGFERLKSLDETETQMKALGYRGEKLTQIMDSTKQSVDGTRFMLQDMAKVATGALGSGVTEKYSLNEYLTRTADLAQLTGLDVDKMGAIMNKAYSRGKVNAQLLNQFNARGIPIYKLLQKQLGVNAKELADMTRKGEVGFDDLYKATDRYNGLAQKMGTNTLSGAATVLTQQFGLAGAEFLEGVYEPIKSGVKGIVAALKQLRSSGVFKEWGENLGQTVKYFVDWFQKGEASMTGMSDGAKNLATVLSPVIKGILGLVKAIGSLPPSVQGALGAFVLFGGPALKVIGSLITGASNLGANLLTLKMNTSAGVSGLSKLATSLGTTTGAMGVAAAGATALVAWIAAIAIEYKRTKDAQTQYTDSVKEWETEQQGQINAIKSSSSEATIYNQKLQELMAKEHKSATDKQLIKEYVDKLNGSIDNLNLKYDAEKDKLNKTTQAIKDKIEAQKQSAIAAAYEEKVSSGAKKLIELQEDQKKLLKERTEYTKRYNSNTQKTAAVTSAYKAQLADVNKRIDDNKKAQDRMNRSIDQAATAASNLGPKMQAQYNKLVQKAKNAGVRIPSGLKRGIEDGSVKIPTTMNGLYRKINSRFDRAVRSANRAGVKIPENLQRKINQGKVKPANAARQLERAVSKKLDKAPSAAKKAGNNTSSGFAKGVGSKTDLAQRKGKALKDAAKKGADSNPKSSGAHTAGSNFASGFASGIIGGIDSVVQNAVKLFTAAKNAVSKKQKDGSPARRMIPHGVNFATGYEKGILKEIPAVKRASDKLVTAAMNEATVKVPSMNITTDGMQKAIGAEVQRGVNVMLQGQAPQTPTNTVFNITVDGSKDPAAFADELVRDLKLKVRTV